MHTARALNSIDPAWMTNGVMAGEQAAAAHDTAESLRLAQLVQDNHLLRQCCADLTAAAELWIRLYESALARANAAEAGGSARGGSAMAMRANAGAGGMS